MVTRVFDLSPLPQPLPTVTVTETVLVPTSMPTPIVNVPPESVNWLSTLMEGFAGALIGAFLGGLAAVYVLRRSMESERERVAAVNREAAANELIRTLEELQHAIERGDDKQIRRSDTDLRLISTRLARIHAADENHKFMDWLLDRSSDLCNRLKRAAEDSDQLNGLPRQQKYDLNRDIMILREGCIAWIRWPSSWEEPEPRGLDIHTGTS